VTVLFVIIGLAVGAGIVLVALGAVPSAASPIPDRAIAELPTSALTKPDIDAVRFGVGLRGYRMDEVDGVLDRAATEIALLDTKVADLEAQLGLGRTEAMPGESPAVEVESV